MPAAKLRNLILVNHPAGQARRDFEEIAALIETQEPTIAVHIVDQGVPAEASGLPADVWERPTLTVSFQWPRFFRPKRGIAYVGHPLNKLEQLRKFQAAGVPTPRTTTYPFAGTLPRSEWGDHVILKPSRLGLKSGGRHTFLVRTEQAGPLAERLFPAAHAPRGLPVMVQRFIDTGEYPANYRVLCLFGEPLLCMEYKLMTPRPSLDAPDEVLLEAAIASNTDGRYHHALVAPPDVLAFARRVAAAMPRIPLHGIDVVRELATGALFALENNPGGNTWHFSSRMSEEGRREVTREQRIAQFGAWEIAARVLAERTMREAC